VRRFTQWEPRLFLNFEWAGDDATLAIKPCRSEAALRYCFADGRSLPGVAD
jgi:hypothetical protein